MKNKIMSASLLIFLVTPVVFAKPQPPKKVAETFSATENNGTPTVVNANSPVEQNLVDEELDSNTPVAVKNTEKTKVKPTSITSQEIKSSQSTNEESEKFDVVPSSKIPEIAERVKYTYDILKRFGRAYDYRTTTLSELKKILIELENQTSKEVSKNKS